MVVWIMQIMIKKINGRVDDETDDIMQLCLDDEDDDFMQSRLDDFKLGYKELEKKKQ